MNIVLRYLGSAAGCLCACAVVAQQPSPVGAPPPKPTAQSEAGEPRANTGDPVAPGVAAEPPRAGAPQHAPAPAAAVAPKANAADKLQLGTATVTGDREQPKVMYVVPWKKSDIGDLGGKPMNSLIDEVLAPVDRDTFKREVGYYQTMKSGASLNGAQPAAGQGEK